MIDTSRVATNRAFRLTLLPSEDTSSSGKEFEMLEDLLRSEPLLSYTILCRFLALNVS